MHAEVHLCLDAIFGSSKKLNGRVAGGTDADSSVLLRNGYSDQSDIPWICA